jgi:hypothetical protein
MRPRTAVVTALCSSPTMSLPARFILADKSV